MHHAPIASKRCRLIISSNDRCFAAGNVPGSTAYVKRRAVVESTTTVGTRQNACDVSFGHNLQRLRQASVASNHVANDAHACRSHVSSADESNLIFSLPGGPARAQSAKGVGGFCPAWIFVRESSTPFHSLVRFGLNRDAGILMGICDCHPPVVRRPCCNNVLVSYA